MIVIHDQHQMYAGTTRGAARGFPCRHAPAADDMQGGAHGRSVDSSAGKSRFAGHRPASIYFVDLPETDRDFGANRRRGLFRCERHANGLANQFLVAERVRNRLTQRHQSHLKFPCASSQYASTHTGKRFADEQKDTAAGVRND